MKHILTLFVGVVLLVTPFSAFAAFDTNLSYGATNSTQVTELQEFLTDQGFYAGPITGNFFSLTQTAVKRFQTAEGITPVSGYFGPLSRAKATELLNIPTSEQSTSTSVTTPPVSSAWTYTLPDGSIVQVDASGHATFLYQASQPTPIILPPVSTPIVLPVSNPVVTTPESTPAPIFGTVTPIDTVPPTVGSFGIASDDGITYYFYVTADEPLDINNTVYPDGITPTSVLINGQTYTNSTWKGMHGTTSYYYKVGVSISDQVLNLAATTPLNSYLITIKDLAGNTLVWAARIP